jgi:hypothetical protein
MARMRDHALTVFPDGQMSMLIAEIDALTAQVDYREARIDELIAERQKAEAVRDAAVALRAEDYQAGASVWKMTDVLREKAEAQVTLLREALMSAKNGMNADSDDAIHAMRYSVVEQALAATEPSDGN